MLSVAILISNRCWHEVMRFRFVGPLCCCCCFVVVFFLYLFLLLYCISFRKTTGGGYFYYKANKYFSLIFLSCWSYIYNISCFCALIVIQRLNEAKQNVSYYKSFLYLLWPQCWHEMEARVGGELAQEGSENQKKVDEGNSPNVVPLLQEIWCKVPWCLRKQSYLQWQL